jgi:hypothetical protein
MRDDHLVPDTVYRQLRPGLAFLRVVHGPNSRQFREKLVLSLRGMEEQVAGDIGDLYDKIAGTRIGKDKTLRALLMSNEARLRYLAWYHRGEPYDLDGTEALFSNSLALNLGTLSLNAGTERS